MVPDFYQEDRGLFSSTLITAQAAIKGTYPLIPRGRVGPSGEVRVMYYRDGGPVLGYNDSGRVRLAEEERREYIGRESKFADLRAAYPELNDFVIHNIMHPVSGYGQKKMTIFECRWLAASAMAATLAFCAKLVLMQMMCLQATNRWYDNNICIPLTGKIVRPWESTRMRSIVVIAEGDIGNTYFSKFDNTVGFDQMSDHMAIQAFFHHKVMIRDPRLFIVMPFVRGGERYGGKGNQYANSDPLTGAAWHSSRLWEQVVTEKLFKGELLGDNSNFAVLQGYNSAMEDPFYERHHDLRGCYHENDFLGRLVESDEFTEIQAEPAFPGVMFLNQLLPLNQQAKIMPADPSKYCFSDVAENRRINFIVDQATQWHRSHTGEWKRIASAHRFGEEDVGYVQRQTSRAMVKVAH